MNTRSTSARFCERPSRFSGTPARHGSLNSRKPRAFFCLHYVSKTERLKLQVLRAITVLPTSLRKQSIQNGQGNRYHAEAPEVQITDELVNGRVVCLAIVSVTRRCRLHLDHGDQYATFPTACFSTGMILCFMIVCLES